MLLNNIAVQFFYTYLLSKAKAKQVYSCIMRIFCIKISCIILYSCIIGNTLRIILSHLNNNGEHLKDIISSLTHFYSCIDCRVINVQNGEVTYVPPIIINCIN